jgi:hypothetical protein
MPSTGQGQTKIRSIDKTRYKVVRRRWLSWFGINKTYNRTYKPIKLTMPTSPRASLTMSFEKGSSWTRSCYSLTERSHLCLTWFSSVSSPPRSCTFFLSNHETYANKTCMIMTLPQRSQSQCFPCFLLYTFQHDPPQNYSKNLQQPFVQALQEFTWLVIACSLIWKWTTFPQTCHFATDLLSVRLPLSQWCRCLALLWRCKMRSKGIRPLWNPVGKFATWAASCRSTWKVRR